MVFSGLPSLPANFREVIFPAYCCWISFRSGSESFFMQPPRIPRRCSSRSELSSRTVAISCNISSPNRRGPFFRSFTPILERHSLCHRAGPSHKISARLEGVKLVPKYDARLLKNLFCICRIWHQRENESKNPVVALGVTTQELGVPLLTLPSVTIPCLVQLGAVQFRAGRAGEVVGHREQRNERNEV